MKPVTMYTTENCPFCSSAKSLLGKRKIEYTEINLARDPDGRNELIEKTATRLDANLAAAKGELDALTVRAPADGVLTALDAHVGEEKTRGQHLGQIDRDGGFKVTVPVDEFYLARVKPGQHVAVTIDDKTAMLVVAKVYPQVKDGKFQYVETIAP